MGAPVRPNMLNMPKTAAVGYAADSDLMANAVATTGDDEPSPLDLVARADCPCGDEGPEDAGKCQCVQIYGHEYSIDNDADFSGILMQPNLVTGVDVQLVKSKFHYAS